MRRSLMLALCAALLSVPSSHAAGPSKTYVPGQTPDGQPDLSGMWVNFDPTPFETGGQPAFNDAVLGVNPPANWTENASPTSRANAARKAMVVDPPDGIVPVMKWAEDKRTYDFEHVNDSWVYQTPWERCITRGIPAGMFPAGYDNAYRFMQTPGYVVIVYEMIHQARVIPLDGRPHVGARIREWDGDPRGHWEGNTLVVDTTNYNNKGSIATSAATGRIRGIPQSEALHVVERFRMVDATTIDYQVTIDDPGVYAKPWRVEIPLIRDSKYQMYEYACAEGNYATPNMLAAGRAADRAVKSGDAR
ncbi:MAG TPA: hypothetical protein VLV86_16950 [Vicinamibacterales bacterium]|nr:hypothetical protein [Vicinamibacterales bacterium]